MAEKKLKKAAGLDGFPVEKFKAGGETTCADGYRSYWETGELSDHWVLRICPDHQHQEDEHHWSRCSNVLSINIKEHTLEVVQYFTYLGSIISNNMPTDGEIKMHRQTHVQINKECVGKRRTHTEHLGSIIKFLCHQYVAVRQ